MKHWTSKQKAVDSILSTFHFSFFQNLLFHNQEKGRDEVQLIECLFSTFDALRSDSEAILGDRRDPISKPTKNNEKICKE